jgi:hypothetical protein
MTVSTNPVTYPGQNFALERLRLSNSNLYPPSANHSRSIGLEGERNGGGGKTSEKNIGRPLPALGLRLLSRLDTPKPAGRRIELVLAAASLSSGGHGETSGGEGLSDAACGAQRRNSSADEGHGISSRCRGRFSDGMAGGGSMAE